MDITDLLILTQKNKASDLHLTANHPPVLRVNGEIHTLKMDILTSDNVKEMLYAIMNDHQRSEYEREMELDFAISYGDNMRFRVNAFNTLSGHSAVLRLIPSKIMNLKDVGAPDIIHKLCNLHKGLILVTGPTGSGKSTTLAAMVDYINSNFTKHIITIEDPIEFVHKSKQSLINQREIHTNTKSFSRALKSCLREDPDVILVGEMRDLETIQLAITAAETGHLVMGTLHTSSAAKTIDRIIDVFPTRDKEMIRSMLSVSLEGIITQTLLRRKDGTGRIAAHEILLATPAIRNLIREDKIPQIQSIMQLGTKLGMCTMKDRLYALMEEGVIFSDDVRSLTISASNEAGSTSDDARQPTHKPMTQGDF